MKYENRRYTQFSEDLRALRALLDAGLIDAQEAAEMRRYVECLAFTAQT